MLWWRISVLATLRFNQFCLLDNFIGFKSCKNHPQNPIIKHMCIYTYQEFCLVLMTVDKIIIFPFCFICVRLTQLSNSCRKRMISYFFFRDLKTEGIPRKKPIYSILLWPTCRIPQIGDSLLEMVRQLIVH